MKYICRKCNKEYPINTYEYYCECGGLFDLKHPKREHFFSNIKNLRDLSLWQYEDILPFNKDEIEDITMMEGLTPLINIENNLYAKAEYYMPTLSFKDRGGVMLVALARKIGSSEIAIDSSGNAGTSVSAYSARAGIKCHVFVPESTSESKLKQIKAHGGIIHLVPGSREDTSMQIKSFVKEKGIFYASHIYNPIFFEGTKTYFYEVYEQLGGKMPEVFILPVGNGTLVLGAQKAFIEMTESGLIEKWPKIVGVQALNCSPLLHEKFQPDKFTKTIAEGIAIANPPRRDQILSIISKSGGEIIGISEEEILISRDILAKQGLYVEITSAINYAAYTNLKDSLQEDDIVVIPLCGAGLKSV